MGGARMSVTVAAHRPEYLPRPHYFHKIAGVTDFVFLDDVQYPRGQSRANSCQVKAIDGARQLTIPVQEPQREGRIAYLEVRAADGGWREQHLKTVEYAYKRAPYFEDVFPWYEGILGWGNLPLVQINLCLIAWVLSYLKVNTILHSLSSMGVKGRKSDLIIGICKHLGADVYLSSQGAQVYDEAAFRAAGIRLEYQRFRPPAYPQLWGYFVPGLSILDLVMNCGPESREVLGL